MGRSGLKLSRSSSNLSSQRKSSQWHRKSNSFDLIEQIKQYAIQNLYSKIVTNHHSIYQTDKQNLHDTGSLGSPRFSPEGHNLESSPVISPAKGPSIPHKVKTFRTNSRSMSDIPLLFRPSNPRVQKSNMASFCDNMYSLKNQQTILSDHSEEEK